MLQGDLFRAILEVETNQTTRSNMKEIYQPVILDKDQAVRKAVKDIGKLTGLKRSALVKRALVMGLSMIRGQHETAPNTP